MGGTHRPLMQILFGAYLERVFPAENVAFALGAGDSLASDIAGILTTWIAFYSGLCVFYSMFAPAVARLAEAKYPDAPCNKVSPSLVANMKEVAKTAFPMYATMPVITDFFVKKGWSVACDSMEECGGVEKSVLMCVLYFFALEVVIFCDHYYLLHKWDVGKKFGQHAYHHVYKYANQLNAFSGYSFAPQDGWSQGMALPLCTLFVPVPIAFVFTMEILTGLWTLYIHTDVSPLPWPLMGCDYHYIHHRYNWYNFGFMTCLMDTLFKTVKHPKEDALDKSHGKIPMPAAELRRSAELTDAILAKRGAQALQSDDAAGNEQPATDASSAALNATIGGANLVRRPVAGNASPAS